MACEYTSARVSTALFVKFLSRPCVVALLALAVACASKSTRVPTGTPDPDKFLFERGTEALDKRRWFTAREYFRQLVDTYPQSPYRAHAKLGIADTYIGEGSAEVTPFDRRALTKAAGEGLETDFSDGESAEHCSDCQLGPDDVAIRLELYCVDHRAVHQAEAGGNIAKLRPEEKP